MHRIRGFLSPALSSMALPSTFSSFQGPVFLVLWPEWCHFSWRFSCLHYCHMVLDWGHHWGKARREKRKTSPQRFPPQLLPTLFRLQLGIVVLGIMVLGGRSLYCLKIIFQNMWSLNSFGVSIWIRIYFNYLGTCGKEFENSELCVCVCPVGEVSENLWFLCPMTWVP